MSTKMDIAGNIISIIQRNSGNIDKDILIDRISRLSETSLIVTPDSKLIEDDDQLNGN